MNDMNISNNNKTIFISSEYIKDTTLKNKMYFRYADSSELLGKLWRSYDFQKAEDKVFELQCSLTRATFKKNKELIRRIQDKIVFSAEARMLAVRKVSEIARSGAGVDGIVWRKDSDKMRAAICLHNYNEEYKAKPLKHYVFRDLKSNKDRQVGIPAVYDRAMQVLYAYALEPVAEVTADRKSFAFRKYRSPEMTHSFIMQCLTDTNPPEWVLITDIASYYDTISHEWLINNIPINKKILKEFLKSGMILNGELFYRDKGISLGSNLSTILGNMTLDGLQYRLYDLQGDRIQDYKNGWCLRFADDILVTARTEEDAKRFLEEIKKFAVERGLILSDKKTKITNIRDGFDFLSRFYCKIDGIVRCIPSEKAVKNFEKEVEELIFENKDNWSQNKLIQSVNAKITGFATYHRCEESTDVFKHIDVIINAFLLKLLRELYPNQTREQLIKKFWKEDSYGRQVFTLINNKDKHITNMADTILMQERRIDTSKNIFLNREYYENIENTRDIYYCAGRYKKVWERQEGICYICQKPIHKGHNKAIIFKKKSRDKTIKNMAYVHEFCKNSIMQYVDIEEDVRNVDLREILHDITNKKVKKESKFIKLSEYFHNLRKNSITLTFEDIEKIIGFKLCKSAYKYRTYFTNKQAGMIAESWTTQGYKVTKVDMKNYKITFNRFDFRRTKVVIPKFMYRLDLPEEAVEETKKFFLHLKEKYRLK